MIYDSVTLINKHLTSGFGAWFVVLAENNLIFWLSLAES